MTYSEIIGQVAKEVGMTKAMADKAYRAYWRDVREHIVELPLKEELTDEEFLQLRPNVNIPSIGKLYVTLDRYHGMKEYFRRHFKSYKGKKYAKENNNAEDQED